MAPAYIPFLNPALRPGPVRGAARCIARCAALALGVTGLLLATSVRPAVAAEVTDVLDAFDDDNDDPFDFALRLRYTSDVRTSRIARETKCLQNDYVGGSACPGGSGIVFANELTYERVRNAMAIDARFGVFKDVEVYLSLPIVISDGWNHAFEDGVTTANSTISQPSANESLFAVDFKSKTRAGLGDMQAGVRWAPFNWYRDSAHPSWVIGLESTFPTGEAMKADNDSVGLGLTQLEFYSTISRRTLKILEPFFHFRFQGRFGASDGLFVSKGGTQNRTSPGPIVGTQIGLAVIPWENAKREERIEIEAGFGSVKRQRR